MNYYDKYIYYLMYAGSSIKLKGWMDGWMDGWLGFNGILSTQVAAISCLRKFKVC